MKLVHKHIIHNYLHDLELITRFNNAQKAGKIITESRINGTKVHIIQNNTLLMKIRMIRDIK